jgi:hypothetical protein
MLPGAVIPRHSGASVRTIKHRLLNAYYFRAHLYTMVPHQVREDLKWMRDVGTQAVSIAVLEQDLFAAVENIHVICDEAGKLGMDVYAVPSRWAGLFAGAPKVPSLFSVCHPDTWVLERDGSPKFSDVSGVISSVHYPETFEFFRTSIDKMFSLWDLKGVIWDEPKMLQSRDFSGKAVEKLGTEAPIETHVRAFVDFMSRINRYIKTAHPEKRTCLFAYAFLDDWQIEMAVNIDGLDEFGCDGRPWYAEDKGKNEASGKVLLGKEGGERFLTAAKMAGKKSVWLIENHNMATSDILILDRRLPEVLLKEVDHLIYYYYPRNLEDPDRIMNVIRKHLLNRVSTG